MRGIVASPEARRLNAKERGPAMTDGKYCEPTVIPGPDMACLSSREAHAMPGPGFFTAAGVFWKWRVEYLCGAVYAAVSLNLDLN